jgi:Cysteine rich repeat
MLFARMLIVSATLLAAGAALAQDRAQGESACGRDASRFCKKVINDGDMAILGCLKENRARLRPACVKHLQDHGQL